MKFPVVIVTAAFFMRSAGVSVKRQVTASQKDCSKLKKCVPPEDCKTLGGKCVDVATYDEGQKRVSMVVGALNKGDGYHDIGRCRALNDAISKLGTKTFMGFDKFDKSKMNSFQQEVVDGVQRELISQHKPNPILIEVANAEPDRIVSRMHGVLMDTGSIPHRLLDKTSDCKAKQDIHEFLTYLDTTFDGWKTTVRTLLETLIDPNNKILETRTHKLATNWALWALIQTNWHVDKAKYLCLLLSSTGERNSFPADDTAYTCFHELGDLNTLDKFKSCLDKFKNCYLR